MDPDDGRMVPELCRPGPMGQEGGRHGPRRRVSWSLSSDYPIRGARREASMEPDDGLHGP
jgi:hypothetical protein